MNLIFFGTQDWAAKLLEHLIKDGFFKIVGIVTQPDKPVGRKQEFSASPVKEVAVRHGINVLQPQKLTDKAFLSELKSLEPQIALVIAYGRILPQQILDTAPLGFINVHPSLLPLWRGPSPIQTAIAAGNTASGVTIMKIDEQMDHGPILVQAEIPLEKNETPQTFLSKVVDVSGRLFVKTLKDYVNGTIKPKEQDHKHASICKMLTREDGQIDWNETDKVIEQKIRAYQPWPGTWTSLRYNERTLRLKILRAQTSHVESVRAIGTLFSSDDRLLVGAKNSLLEITSLQPEGKAPMPAKAFLSGYAHLLGSQLG